MRHLIGRRALRMTCSAIGIVVVVCYLFPVY